MTLLQRILVVITVATTVTPGLASEREPRGAKKEIARFEEVLEIAGVERRNLTVIGKEGFQAMAQHLAKHGKCTDCYVAPIETARVSRFYVPENAAQDVRAWCKDFERALEESGWVAAPGPDKSLAGESNARRYLLSQKDYLRGLVTVEFSRADICTSDTPCESGPRYLQLTGIAGEFKPTRLREFFDIFSINKTYLDYLKQATKAQ